MEESEEVGEKAENVQPDADMIAKEDDVYALPDIVAEDEKGEGESGGVKAVKSFS